MYELEELTKIGEQQWLCVITGPGNHGVRVKWTTTDNEEKLIERALNLAVRLQVSYARKFKGNAVSHWRSIAATGTEKTNLERLKKRRRAEVEEWKRSRGGRNA